MTHPDIGPELRALAQSILDRLDPAVRAAAATLLSSGAAEAGRCQQVWCPVCALAALVSGEQHPMLTLVAEHSVTVMALLRDMAAASGSAAPAESPEEAPGQPTAEADQIPGDQIPGRYQSIPIVIEQTTVDE